MKIKIQMQINRKSCYIILTTSKNINKCQSKNYIITSKSKKHTINNKYKYLTTNYIHLATLLNTIYYYYTFDNSIKLLSSGDIEPNRGPLKNILRIHPIIHKKGDKLYFIPNTINLKPKYKSIKINYEPFLNPNHLNHQKIQQIHCYLYRFIQNHSNIHPTRLLCVLVIIQGPLPNQ